MPITGRLNADFQSFYDACRQAEVSLKGFDSATKTVERSLDSMATAFPGATIATEAGKATKAVDAIAPTAKTARLELASVGGVVKEGSAAWKTYGQAVDETGTAAGVAGESLKGTAQALGLVDSILKPLGINIGPVKNAVTDLTAASAESAGAFSGLAQASLVAASALAGIKVGRWVADLAGTDKAIGDLTLELLGFGQLLKNEEAAAGLETLARASEHAGFAITDMASAIKINEEWAKKATAANIALGQAAERGIASEKNAAAIANFNAELEKFRQSGFLDDLTRDLQSNVFTTKQLADAYQLSEQAVAAFATESANAARIEESNAKKLADVRDVLTKRIGEQEEEKRIALEKSTAAMYAQIDASYKATEAAKAQRDAENEAQAAKQKTDAQKFQERDAANAQADAERAKQSATVVGSFDVGSVAGARAYLDAPAKTMEDFIHLWNGSQIHAPLDFIEKQFQQYQEAREIARQTLNQNDPTDVRYMTGAQRDAAAAAARGARGASAFGTAAATPPVTINVSGVLDPRTIDELSTKVSGAILRRTGAKVPAYG